MAKAEHSNLWMIGSWSSSARPKRRRPAASSCRTPPRRSRSAARSSRSGPGKLLDSGKRGEMSVKVGDEVFYGKYAGTGVEIDGKKYVILRETDILAIIEKSIEVTGQSQWPRAERSASPTLTT